MADPNYLPRDDAEDARRWRYFAEHAQDDIDGMRMGEWLQYKGVMTHGSRNAAIDALRHTPRAGAFDPREKELLELLAWALPHADAYVSRELSDGNFGLADDLAKVERAKTLLGEAFQKAR